jgi:hypothetical protein
MPRPQRDFERALQAAKAKAMRQLAVYLEASFTDEISAVKWGWPNPPTTRDIVDKNRLRSSLTREINEDDSVTFTWATDYASHVHEGYVATNGQRYPARPWTREPLKEVPTKFGVFLRAALERSS